MNSLDISRNSEDNYEVVLPYQRYVSKNSKNKKLKEFVKKHDISNYDTQYNDLSIM